MKADYLETEMIGDKNSDLIKQEEKERPKRPGSPYLLFSREKMSEKLRGKPRDYDRFREISKSIAAEWKQLPDSEKQVRFIK